MRYRAILEAARDGGFTVSIPAFPSISAVGSTEEEALQSARRAIAEEIDFDVERPAAADVKDAASVQINVNSGTILRDGQPVQPRGVTLALLVMLAVEPRDVSTEIMCERLYPTAKGEAAYNALKMAVYRARQQLGSQEAIETTQRGYRLADDVIVDIRFLPQIVRAIRMRSVAKSVEYRLSGIFEELMRGRPAVYAMWEWFAPFERLLQVAAREIGVHLGEQLLSSGKPVASLEVARRLITRDLLDEAAYELAIRAHLALGNRASALLEYRSYAGRLQARLGLEPPLALRRLVEVE